MQRRSFNRVVALVGIGLAGVVAVSAATALAARSAPSPFELIVEGRGVDVMASSNGTFTSRAPFCETGTPPMHHIRASTASGTRAATAAGA